MLGLGLSLWNAALGGGGGAVPPTANLWGDFDYSRDITTSQWDDVSGNAHHATLFNTPTIDADGVLFNGTTQYGKTAADAALVQPETIYQVVKQVSWTTNNRFMDGNAANSGTLIQDTAAVSDHSFHAYAGGYVLDNDGLAINTWGVVCVVFNGASSLTQVNLNAPVTGDVGAANMGGLTIAAKADASVFGNIRLKRKFVYGGVAHDVATRATVISYLMALYSIT